MIHFPTNWSKQELFRRFLSFKAREQKQQTGNRTRACKKTTMIYLKKSCSNPSILFNRSLINSFLEWSLIENWKKKKKTHNVLGYGVNLRIIYERNENINVWTNKSFITFEQNPKQHIALNAQLHDISNSTYLTETYHSLFILVVLIDGFIQTLHVIYKD